VGTLLINGRGGGSQLDQGGEKEKGEGNNSQLTVKETTRKKLVFQGVGKKTGGGKFLRVYIGPKQKRCEGLF